MKQTDWYILILIICIGMLLRLYNLNWGAPFYFHPDERNIAAAVSQLRFPEQMNPHFFAYGSLPLYTIFLTGIISNFFTSCHFTLSSCSVLFEQAIIISRLFSALFSILLIPLTFFLGKKLFDKSAGFLAAALMTLSVGFIQFAHFGTVEMWLTFFGALLLYLMIQTPPKLTRKRILLLGIVMGVLTAIKISSLALLPLPILLFFLRHLRHARDGMQVIGKTTLDTLLFLWVTTVIYLVTNPFVLLDTTSFLNSMRYESMLAAGTLPVFYTQEFFNTVPIVYQFRFIYPFLLNPLITLLFPVAFIFLTYQAIKKQDRDLFFLIAFFLILFLSQAALFAKWTRYMVPTLPFIYLMIAGGLHALLHTKKILAYVFSTVILVVSGVFTFSYFLTVFVMPDTRVQATSFAKQTLPANAKILSEVYDLGIVPFNDGFSDITLFNFYDLETMSPEASPERLTELLSRTDYIILPSQRLYKTRTTNPDRFPKAYAFYSSLKNENEYQKIHETPCDLLCRIVYLNDPIFAYEGTANIFDRPTVMIYKKL